MCQTIPKADSTKAHSKMKFTEKLQLASQENKSLVCVGLDPDPELMPRVGIFRFNKSIVDATSDLVCAYKANLAFYEALGIKGLRALQKTIDYIPRHIPVIGDAKRGDIGNTSRQYAKALFEIFGFDAATVNPYLGYDSVAPFIQYADKGVFILCLTSNPGALDFQSLPCFTAKETGQKALFELVALRAKEWDSLGNIGLVVGATYPEELRKIRKLCPEMTLLIPGIGAQQADLALAVRYGVDASGGRVIFSSSRQIIYASRGRDFASAARQATEQLRRQINSLLTTTK